MFINMLLIHTLLSSDRLDRTSVCQVNVVGGRDWWDNDDGSTVADKKVMYVCLSVSLYVRRELQTLYEIVLPPIFALFSLLKRRTRIE